MSALPCRALLCALTLGGAASVAAQPSPATATASARRENAHADRVITMPTADTQPEGTVFLSSYEIVLLQAGYAFTDKLHVTFGGLADLSGQGGFDLSVKAAVLRSPWLRVAALGSIDYLRGSGDDELQELLAGRVGGALQLCFEPACHSSATLSGFVALTDLPDVLLPIGASAGVIARASRELALLVEYSTLLNASNRIDFVDQTLFYVGYGLRISGDEHWALDTTFLRSMEGTEARDEAPFFRLFGLPFIAFTYRFSL